MKRFRVIAGMHATGNKKLGTQRVISSKDPHPFVEAKTQKEVDFFSKYPDKFQPVSDAVSFSRPDSPAIMSPSSDVVEIDLGKLDKMTVIELKELCSQIGVELDGATLKDEIIGKIKSAVTE